jgi:CelD/BcsL family acetyltransferase involved in cellulose biosynthesis
LNSPSQHERLAEPDSAMRRAETGPATDGLTVERISPALWHRIEDWDEAVAGSSHPSVFLTHDWLASWWQCFGEGLEPCLLRVAEPRGSTVGLAPLYLGRLRTPIRLPVRRLGLLGDQAVGSEYLGLVARAGLEGEVGRAVLDYLGAEAGGWDIAELLGLIDGDPAGEALERGIRGSATRVRLERHPCSMVWLPDDFDTYLAGLSSKFRQSYRQRASKLRRTCSVRFIRTSSEEELRPHLKTLFRMHQEHWITRGYPGSFADARMRRFYLEVARRLLASGRLQFWHLEVDGVIRASQFGFTYNHILHSLQEAFDGSLRLPGVGGLGVVLRAHVIRCAIEERLRGYDFLGGDEDFKRRWGTSVRSVRHVHAVAPGVRGRLAWLAAVRLRDARSWLVRNAPDRFVQRLRFARVRGSSRRVGADDPT